MLIEFSVGNFRSFKEVQTLSFVAAPIKSKYPELDKQNVFEAGEKLKLLKTVGMYGANGSGKSNLVLAFMMFLIFIRDSFRDETTGSRLISPFLLNSKSKVSTSFFQIVFKSNGKRYRYGFEIFGNIIHSEWLFGTAQSNEVFYFTREMQKISINSSQFPEALGLEERTKNSNLFLNVVHAFDGKISKIIKDYFWEYIRVGRGLNDQYFRTKTELMLHSNEKKDQLIDFMKIADLGIVDIKFTEYTNLDGFETPKNQLLSVEGKDNYSILTSQRNTFDEKGNITGLQDIDFDKDESEGTKKYFSLTGVISEVISYGATLFLDEFDARLHPLLTKKIVELFNSPKSNPKNAQLFFVTHDTNLLDPKLLRRDQIYFAEKNAKGESIIYSLTDLNGVRNDASFEKDYIQGKYGAIPFLGGFNKLLGD